MDRADDWSCPNTTCINNVKKVFGSKATCPKCGSSRDQEHDDGGDRAQKGMVGGDMPDDWACPNSVCLNATKLVFGKKASCPSCGAARNAKTPGDWLCPNGTCINSKNNVFASKTTCPKCGTPRPNGGGGGSKGGMGMQQQRMQQQMMLQHQHQQQIQHQMMMQQQMMQQQRMMGQMGGKGKGGGGKGDNDWQCPNQECVNSRRMVFGRHAQCPQCGSGKPAMRAGGGGCGGCGGGGGGNSKPGDWQCPNDECRNHRNNVFEKHATCPSCGAPKPGGGCGGGKGGMMMRNGRERSPRR